MALTVAITIGRNIGSKPMSVKHWEAFQRRVLGALSTATRGGPEPTRFQGWGDWEDTSEDSTIVQRYGTSWLPDYGTGDGSEWLRAELGEIARVYRQEAIALVIGEGELIAPLPLPETRHAFEVIAEGYVTA